MGFGAIDAAPLELDFSPGPSFYRYCAPLELCARLRTTNPSCTPFIRGTLNWLKLPEIA
jgi:hypothetical protein